jgi:hypothetical protein
MYYLRYLCLLAHSGVQHILCCGFGFVCLHLMSCVPNVASFTWLSFLNCQFQKFKGWLNELGSSIT